jgi:magnesium-transporting ATPase (P-type)
VSQSRRPLLKFLLPWKPQISKPVVKAAYINICLIHFQFRWFETRTCFITIYFNFAIEHTIRKVQEYQEEVKLNERNQLLVYANDVNLLGENINTK